MTLYFLYRLSYRFFNGPASGSITGNVRKVKLVELQSIFVALELYGRLLSLVGFICVEEIAWID